MEVLRGIPVSPGITIQKAFILLSEDYQIPQRFISKKEIEKESARFLEARDAVIEQTRKTYKNVARDIGKDLAEIFEAHVGILSDKKFTTEILDRIKDKLFKAEYAVSRVLRKYMKVLNSMDNEYLNQRVADIQAIEKMLIAELLGESRKELDIIDQKVALIARELTPAQTASLNTEMIKGIATDLGGATSHAAIMSRAMGIPAVAGLETVSTDVSGSDLVIIDGNKGIVIIAPDKAVLEKYRSSVKKYFSFERRIYFERLLPSETMDGFRIQIFGNIEFPKEIKKCLENGAEGIGLYRTEYLFLQNKKIPTENTHTRAYTKSLDMLNGRPLVIRTLDLGADKFRKETTGTKEENPYLGCRSIRLCQEQPQLFIDQVRAILKTAVRGDVRMLLPMITTVEELHWAKNIIQNVSDEFTRDNIAHNSDVPLGIMVEVPSIALLADTVAEEVDFFSIGTNDLIQYTNAVDRNNERVASLYSPASPAVLRLIRMVIETGKATGTPVSICGEMSSDPLYIILLLGLGIEQISVIYQSIPEIKKIIRSVTITKAERLVDIIYSVQNRDDVNKFLRQELYGILPASPSLA